MERESILGELYERYYVHQEFSSVTSSHWKKYGSLTHVAKKYGDYVLRGEGFGNFIPRGSLKALRYFFLIQHSLSLLRKFRVSDSIAEAGFQAARMSGRHLEIDSLKQILSIDLLGKQGVLQRAKTIVVIGDGYGFTTSLLKILYPQAAIVCINLGRILFFDVYYFRRVFPLEPCVLFHSHEDVAKQASVTFWEAEKFQSLFSLPVDLFIAIASLQEMDMGVVHRYFTLMRSGEGERCLYCCNRSEKILPDGSANRLNEYPWDKEDEIVIDEACPWLQKFPVTRLPFQRVLHGQVRHRLVRLCAEKT